jgi:starch-binding outer membrane protein SusE/F
MLALIISATSFSQSTAVSIVGDATTAGWSGTALPFVSTNGVNYTLTADLTVNGCKLILDDGNGAWCGHNSSISGFPSGVAQHDNEPNTKNIDVTVAGNYLISVNGTTKEYSFVLTSTLGVKDFENKNFSVGPNPTSSNWVITSGKNDITAVRIVDVTGKTVYTSTGKATNNATIDASHLANGQYFAKISSATATETVKLIKN